MFLGIIAKNGRSIVELRRADYKEGSNQIEIYGHLAAPLIAQFVNNRVCEDAFEGINAGIESGAHYVEIMPEELKS